MEGLSSSLNPIVFNCLLVGPWNQNPFKQASRGRADPLNQRRRERVNILFNPQLSTASFPTSWSKAVRCRHSETCQGMSGQVCQTELSAIYPSYSVSLVFKHVWFCTLYLFPNFINGNGTRMIWTLYPPLGHVREGNAVQWTSWGTGYTHLFGARPHSEETILPSPGSQTRLGFPSLCQTHAGIHHM